MSDYLDIILKGYIDNPKYFKQYLIREQKLAEKEFVEPKEFYSRCKDVVALLDDNLYTQLYKAQKELKFMIGRAKAKTSTFSSNSVYKNKCYD